MKFIRKIKEEKGTILIESIVGISLVTVGILGIIALLTRSSGLYNSAVNNLKATYFAAEGIEVVKNITDTNYVENNNQWTPPTDGWYYLDYSTPGNSFTSVEKTVDPLSAKLVKFDSSGGVYVSPDASTGENTIFKRIAEIKNFADHLDVKSYVSWKEGENQRQILLEDYFYKWRP
mgnify:CR=1 FL=1